MAAQREASQGSESVLDDLARLRAFSRVRRDSSACEEQNFRREIRVDDHSVHHSSAFGKRRIFFGIDDRGLVVPAHDVILMFSLARDAGRVVRSNAPADSTRLFNERAVHCEEHFRDGRHRELEAEMRRVIVEGGEETHRVAIAVKEERVRLVGIVSNQSSKKLNSLEIFWL